MFTDDDYRKMMTISQMDLGDIKMEFPAIKSQMKVKTTAIIEHE
jgi:hypothetical protein